MNLVLSDRMRMIAEHVDAGDVVADIGTDHGYIPIWLVQHQRCRSAILSDINEGPLQKAAGNIRRYAPDSEALFDLRRGDGLEILRPGEAETVILAGMGGILIRKILQASPDIASDVKTLILQPRRHAHELRRWLRTRPYGLIPADEAVAREGKKFSEILMLKTEDRMTGEQWERVEKSRHLEQRLGFPPDIYEDVPAMYLLRPTVEVCAYLEQKIERMDVMIHSIRTRGQTEEAFSRMEEAVRKKSCLVEMKKEAEHVFDRS